MNHPSTAGTRAASVRALGSAQGALEMELNHTLSALDLGAKFECHVEHDAIDLAPSARVVSSEHEQDGALARSPDQMLDLHPALAAGEPATGSGAITSGVGRSLDSHIQLDLNGK